MVCRIVPLWALPLLRDVYPRHTMLCCDLPFCNAMLQEFVPGRATTSYALLWSEVKCHEVVPSQ